MQFMPKTEAITILVKVFFSFFFCLSQGDRQVDNLSLCRSMIAIWSILEPSLPQKILVAVHEITAACFNTSTANLVFAGQEDGSLCMWDLRENSHCHQKVETEHREWVLRSPTYSTGN